ncbi:hypothetical protein FH972_024704 [Carpinus fangiana]|uniref:Macro domain-containing protein n=1 Tax=Carpinus fangiana TaxID=176857 RepID=A0A5N6KZG6_9ROSI|nr:hypothetical protein FH972_024704 [Carpinus fangiana]
MPPNINFSKRQGNKRQKLEAQAPSSNEWSAWAGLVQKDGASQDTHSSVSGQCLGKRSRNSEFGSDYLASLNDSRRKIWAVEQTSISPEKGKFKISQASPNDNTCADVPDWEAQLRAYAATTGSDESQDNSNSPSETNVNQLIGRTESSNGEICLEYTDTSIFSAGPYALIIHACNAKGLWGSGIALAMRQRYPQHFQVYQDYCQSHSSERLLGTSILIGPSESVGVTLNKYAPTHWIGCLFTNKDVGHANLTQRRLQEGILRDTKLAMKNLLEHINNARRSGMTIDEIHMPQINSGAFRTPWERTVDTLREVSVQNRQDGKPWKIYVHTFGGNQ